MKRKLEVSELIFQILSYVFMTIFALCCLYPFVYAVSGAVSSREAVEFNRVVLLPLLGNEAEGYHLGVQFAAFRDMFRDDVFWISYSNTLFLTFFGTIWSILSSILGAYALSKKRLLFRRGFNFFLVFTMWFSAGIVPQYLNYISTKNVFESIGIVDEKWLVVIAMGMAAMNIILLRNAFEGVPSEIEEAARVDGATEFQILTKVYVPMSKSTIATVTLFFAISRWNGYYWARQMIRNPNEKPLQVYVREYFKKYSPGSEFLDGGTWNEPYAPNSAIYSLLVCSIIPILVIYPFIQKYFAKGVNMGGVKE